MAISELEARPAPNNLTTQEAPQPALNPPIDLNLYRFARMLTQFCIDNTYTKPPLQRRHYYQMQLDSLAGKAGPQLTMALCSLHGFATRYPEFKNVNIAELNDTVVDHLANRLVYFDAMAPAER